MELKVLGPIEVTDQGEAVPLPGGRARTVLAALALHHGHAVSVERLVAAAWGDDAPVTARAQVQAMVSALRRALGGTLRPQAIRTRQPGYALSADAVRTDLDIFVRWVAEGRREAAEGDPTEAARLLRTALGQWRGPAFDGLPSAYLEAEAARLDETRLGVLEECIGLELSLGARPDLIAEIRLLATSHPLRETGHRLLMTALRHAGRHAEALTAYQDARRVLVDELGVEPGPALRTLYQEILADGSAAPWPEPPAPDARPGSPGRIPAARAPLFGRDRDVEELVALVATRRLVTLVGPPGIGKTSVSLVVAQRLGADMPDGTWVVELEGVSRPDLVPAAVAAALGVAAGPGKTLTEALTAGLGPRVALLVLDNCEHVLDACADLADTLLARCEGLHLLATSREPLAVAGETVRTVGPLDLPPGDSAEALLGSASGRMLMDRAAARLPAFTMTDEVAPLAASVCRATEGVPLALELVAAQLRALPLNEVADRIDRQLDLLVRRRARPARHSSLRAAIDWSHQLLTGRERRVLAELSVFAGGFTLSAAEAVVAVGAGAADEADVPSDEPSGDSPGRPADRGPDPSAGGVRDIVRDLVDRSLVVADPDARPARYRLLGAVREFAAEQTVLTGSADATRQRHAVYYRSLAARIRTSVPPGDTVSMKRELRREMANLRAVLDWSFGSVDPCLGVDLVGALSWLWAGLPREGLDWVRRALARLEPEPPAARRRVLYAAGLISFSLDLDEAAGNFQEAARLAEECGDVKLQLEAFAQLSVVRCLQGRAAEAAGIAEAVLTPVLAYGTEWSVAEARVAVAIARCGLGELAGAAEQLAQAEEVFVRTGLREGLATTRWAQAEVAYHAGDSERAAALSAAALRDTALGDDLFATVCRQAQHARNLHAAGERRSAAEGLAAVLRDCADKGLWMPAVDALTTAARQEADAARSQRAATLLAAVGTLRTSTGRKPAAVEQPLLDALERRAQSELDESVLAEAQKRGAAMTTEQAICYALEPGATA
ncbi:BTAD domain-containing putative transcriptional regulator [Streptomyces sp. NPDC006430]|uniref:BTAD domain-containing putative transcriptional regulator n=1 Tax=Streptomyces sp. NPDC006430 TaxID=3154299 RepID=UPI0033A9C015